jgi:hypothetical protein
LGSGFWCDKRTSKGFLAVNNFERFYAALGEMIVRWNQAESSMKALLISLSGAEVKAGWILIAELGAVSLEQALKSAARDLAPSDIQAHITQLVNWFSCLREYRNYYTHSIQATVIIDGDGILSQITAKNGLVLHQETLTASQLSRFTDKIVDFTSYVNDVASHASGDRPTESSRGSQPRPLRQMPPLPDRLQKPRQYLTPLRPSLDDSSRN